MSDLHKDDPIRGKLLSAYFDGKFSIEELGKLSDKQAEAVDRVIDKAIVMIKKEAKVTGLTSDGFHTFDELYRYRVLYHAAWLNSERFMKQHKSRKHSDGKFCFDADGEWFIVMTELPTGQISNHYHADYWDLFQIPEQETADEWDGHTPQEAADRLEKYLRGDY